MEMEKHEIVIPAAAIDDPHALNDRAMALHDAGQYEGAILDCSAAIALDPKDADYYINRGATYDALKCYELARNDYNKALRLSPNNPDAYNNRGVCCRLAGDYAQALEDYNSAIALSPNFAMAYRNRARLYEALGETAKSEEDWARAAAIQAPADTTTEGRATARGNHRLPGIFKHRQGH